MKKKALSLLLILCMVLALAPVTAQAATFTVYVVSNTVKVYSKISTSSSVLGTMSYGESMTCLATNSGWAAVKNSKGAIGFCKISALSNVNPNTSVRRPTSTATACPCTAGRRPVRRS